MSVTTLSRSRRAACLGAVDASVFNAALSARGSRQADPLATLRFDLSLITPMMGGGVRKAFVDDLKPIRESEVKHHLRWWWRRLARYGLLPEVNGKRPDKLSQYALYAEECKRFGGMASKDRTVPSSVRVWIDVIKTGAKYAPKNFAKAQYAWFPLIRSKDESSLRLDTTFTVFIECHPDVRNEMAAAVRWWVNFGGIGARTNRGMGSLEQTSIDPPYTLVGDDEAAKCDIQLKIDRTKSANFADAVACWSQAVDWMRRYRQGHDPHDRCLKKSAPTSPLRAGVGDAVRPAGKLTEAYRPGRSRWPDANSVRKIFGIPGNFAYASVAATFVPSFPKAALGMPVADAAIKGSHNEAYLYGSFTISPANGDRLSSPIRVKARAIVKGKYEAIAIAFLDQREVAIRMQVSVKFICNKEVKFTPFPGAGSYPIWTSPTPKPPPIALLGGLNATDPIDGFMRFFGDATKARDFT